MEGDIIFAETHLKQLNVSLQYRSPGFAASTVGRGTAGNEQVPAATAPIATASQGLAIVCFSPSLEALVSWSGVRGPGRKPGSSLYTRNRLPHGGQSESLVPPYTRGSVSPSGMKRLK
jgi:hypothetical protein